MNSAAKLHIFFESANFLPTFLRVYQKKAYFCTIAQQPMKVGGGCND